jgi:hypothetical protein
MTFMMSQANEKNNVDRNMKKPKKTMAKPDKMKAQMIDQHSTSIAKQSMTKIPKKAAVKAPVTPKPKNVVDKNISMMPKQKPTLLAKASFK